MRRVLLADDEPAILRVVRDILGAAFDVEEAESGLDALRLYHEGQYDLLILDAGLRAMSGVELVTKVREDGGRVPIILMTGAAEGVRRAGSFAFAYRVGLLRKPFGVRDLREAVDQAFPA